MAWVILGLIPVQETPQTPLGTPVIRALCLQAEVSVRADAFDGAQVREVMLPDPQAEAACYQGVPLGSREGV